MFKIFLIGFAIFLNAQGIEVVDFLNNKTSFKTPAKKHIFLSFCEVVPMLDIYQDAVGLSQHIYEMPIFRQTYEKLDSIPKVSGGSGSHLNIEVLKTLKPDVVIVWAGNKKEIDFVRNKGINVLAFYPNTINEVFRDIKIIAKALGKEKIAIEKEKNTLKILNLIESKASQIKNKKTAIYLWDKPNKIAGNKGMVADMLNKIGVINLGGDIDLDSAEINLEQLIKLNPQIIFIWGAAKFEPSDILKNPQLKNIQAIKNKAVYKMPLWDNWGPRIVETALISASLAYQESYKNISTMDLINQLNITLFGKQVD